MKLMVAGIQCEDCDTTFVVDPPLPLEEAAQAALRFGFTIMLEGDEEKAYCSKHSP